jgi:glyoxylase-like metal-dependent hydrolase (beta-lactamase superfamily II)
VCVTARPADLASIDIGPLRVTYVPDGSSRIDPVPMFPQTPVQTWIDQSDDLDDTDWLIMTMGSFLIESAGHLALVDLGWGPHDDEIPGDEPGTVQALVHGGELIDNLAQLGITPGDIDQVLLTHLHLDHIGWTVAPAGGPTFANAPHLLTRAEWDYFQTNPELGPTEEQAATLGEHLVLIDDGAEPLPGVRVMMTPGHTPGHASVVIADGDRRAIITGDAVHCPMELAISSLAFAHDHDPAGSQATKQRLLREFAQPGTIVAGGHFPEPVFRSFVGAL